MEDKIYKLLIEESEITWQSIIYDLIKKEEIDPWNINISALALKYIEKIKELKQHNFFISGKVILASSLLLRLKSHKFLTEHISNFDSFLYPEPEQEITEILDSMSNELQNHQEEKIPQLLLKTPQERKKQVTLNELMHALEKALDIDYKREIKKRNYAIIRPAELPKNIINIADVIKSLFGKIISMFKKEEVTFTKLLPSQTKEDKLYTFLPLIYLENEGKICLEQEVPFGEIRVTNVNESAKLVQLP